MNKLTFLSLILCPSFVLFSTTAVGQPPAVKMQKQAPAIQVMPMANGALGQFTFKVPLDIKNLHPQVDGIILSCGVRDAQALYRYNSHVIVPQVNGKIQTTVTLVVNVDGQPDYHNKVHPGVISADMTDWFCSFDLSLNGTAAFPSQDSNAAYYVRTEPGTTLVRSTGGAIPW